MGFDETDPTTRRRWSPEEQRKRDAEIWRLIRAGVLSQREIAKRLGCTLGTVQHVKRREQKRQKLSDALDSGKPGNVVAVITDELAAEDVRTVDDVAQLNTLELYRLRFIPGLPNDVRLAVASAWAALPRQQVVYPIDDGVSWREHCDAAVAGDTDADDDW